MASFLLQREEIRNGTFEDVPSEFAALGTAAHELAAVSVIQRREPYEFLSEEFNGYRAGWEGEINLDAVSIYFNDCMKIIAEANGTGMIMVEDTIHRPQVHPLFKGTVDFAWWNPKIAIRMRDYKNGEGVGVAALMSRQLLYYAFLLVCSEPELQEAPDDLPVELGIVQPNFYGVFEEPDVWTTTLGFVRKWGHGELLPRMWELYRREQLPTEDEHVPGDHCQFCPVMLECVKHQRAFEEYYAADEEFAIMLPNAELDRLYGMREQARRFMKVLDATMYARLIGGTDMANGKLVEKKTNRVWKPGAEAVLKATYGPKAYSPAKVISPAAAEKLDSRGKEIALEYGYKPDANGLTVAPLSDPRPVAKPGTNSKAFAHFETSAEDQGF
jgi:hypothetical protein